MPTTFTALAEALESRLLLSGTVHATHGALIIKLNNRNDNLTVGYSDAAGSAIVVDLNGTKTTVPLAGAGGRNIKLVHIHCGDGNDTVTITPGNGTTAKFFDIQTIIRGGAGQDNISVGNESSLIYGGSGNDTVSAGNGTDSIACISGHDKITVGNGDDYIIGDGTHSSHSRGDTITAGNGNDTILGMAGQDNITVGSGNDTVYAGKLDTVKVGTEAGTGANTVYAYASSDIAVIGRATVDLITRANSHDAWVTQYLAAIDNAVGFENAGTQY